MTRPSLRRLAVLALALGAWCWSAAPALADGSLSFAEDDPGEWELNWTADTGQANVVTATLAANRRTITFTDTGDNTDVTAGTGECNPDTNAATITCTAPARVVSASIDTGDGTDSMTVRGFDDLQAAGGPGSDTITVVPGLDAAGQLAETFVAGDTLFSDDLPSDGVDRITTGDGPDQIDSQGGNDIVSTGGGTDEVGHGGGSDSVNLGPGSDFAAVSGTLSDGSGDVLEGGPGIDTLGAFPEPFLFDAVSTDAFSSSLAAGFVNNTNNGPETNRATGFEDYDGNERQLGAHTVTGTAGSNRISTQLGNDVINPLGGADQVRTDAGNDAIELRDGFADRADCGNGTDRVSADQLDELIDCEVVARSVVRAAGADVRAPSCRLTKVKSSYTTTAFAKGLRPSLTCDEAAAVSFTMIARLKARGRFVTSRVGDLVIAEKRVARGAGARSARVRPSQEFLRRLGKRVKVTVRAEATDEYGNRSAKSKRVSVKPRPGSGSASAGNRGSPRGAA